MKESTQMLERRHVQRQAKTTARPGSSPGGCDINQHFWVFAATTDVGYALRVTDTQAGVLMEYDDTAGNAADAIIDTGAFTTGP